MSKFRGAGIVALLILGLLTFHSQAQAQQVKATQVKKLQVNQLAMRKLITPRGAAINFVNREKIAPLKIKNTLQNLRLKIKQKKLTFKVGYTTALDFQINQITGLKTPGNLSQIAKQQNVRAAKLIKKYRFKKVLPRCVAGARSFDWRRANGVTKVGDQGACGSCWAFATHGAFEASDRIKNKRSIDTSEQATLDCNPHGYSCGGGWWVHQYLIDTGAARESAYPYTAVKGSCRSGVSHPYKAVAWGYVENSGSVPSVSKLKQYLCRYGPLAVAVRVTGAFQAYTGGVFNERSSGSVNHGVTLIGWDDSKHAWLIKNSWGTGWGSTCGYGSSRGYMWIDYNSNKIGYAASWVRAKVVSRPRPVKEDCIPFNPAKIKVTKIKGRWKIVEGSHWIFDFKDKAKEAKKAYDIIRHYKMSRTCYVGRPGPSFKYLLVGSRPPRGGMRGEDCIKFNLAKVKVIKAKGRYKITDGRSWMFDFGNKKAEAVQALNIIKKYKFSYSCFVGRPGPSFSYLRR
jgi:C1A family cysteine protease